MLESQISHEKSKKMQKSTKCLIITSMILVFGIIILCVINSGQIPKLSTPSLETALNLIVLMPECLVLLVMFMAIAYKVVNCEKVDRIDIEQVRNNMKLLNIKIEKENKILYKSKNSSNPLIKIASIADMNINSQFSGSSDSDASDTVFIPTNSRILNERRRSLSCNCLEKIVDMEHIDNDEDDNIPLKKDNNVLNIKQSMHNSNSYESILYSGGRPKPPSNGYDVEDNSIQRVRMRKIYTVDSDLDGYSHSKDTKVHYKRYDNQMHYNKNIEQGVPKTDVNNAYVSQICDVFKTTTV